MFALTRDIAARSGSSSPASLSSSSRVSFLYFCCSLIDTSSLSRFLRRAGFVDRCRNDRVQLARNGHARRVLVEAPLDDLSVPHALLMPRDGARKTICQRRLTRLAPET